MIKKILIYVGSILVSFAAGIAGSLATIPNIPTWYARLDKPPFLPPDQIFGPVWALLYLLIGIALALVILSRVPSKNSAYIWFGTQLILNALWSVVFFGLHLPWLGVVTILVLIASVVITIVKFRQHVPVTIWLLAPYFAWLCFATYLNVGVAILN